MARNRQRAKQRQAERRARRLAEGGDGVRQREQPEGAGPADLAATPPDVDGEFDPHLRVGAPPEEIGRADDVIEEEPDLDEDDFDDTEAIFADEVEDEAEEAYAPRGRRGHDEAAHGRERPRVIQFLANVWAELQRVQWPKRQQLFTLTWVVLGFVLIMGGYLGALDAIFNKLVNAIL